jgi:hypothetical protein
MGLWNSQTGDQLFACLRRESGSWYDPGQVPDLRIEQKEMRSHKKKTCKDAAEMNSP